MIVVSYNDEILDKNLERLSKCRNALRGKIKEIDDIIGLGNTIRTEIVKSGSRIEVPDLDDKGKQKEDKDGKKLTKMEITPPETKIPIDSRTFAEFTNNERDRIFSLVETKTEEICSPLENI